MDKVFTPEKDITTRNITIAAGIFALFLFFGAYIFLYAKTTAASSVQTTHNTSKYRINAPAPYSVILE